MLRAADLARFCREHALPARLVRLSVPTPTVQAAAQAVGCPPEQIVKSVLFLVDGSPVVAVASGLARINRRAVAEHCRVSGKRVRLATPAEVAQYTAYPVGALPPFGHPEPLLTLLDFRVLQQEIVYAGGGAEDTLLEMAPQVIQAAVPTDVVDLIQA
jgi:prolyl-tRNA editing enzyme YbaK/EbsC (Cys-tRNA(Pro) deacylase)